MKTLALQKRLAAKVLKVGLNKVWFDPDGIDEIKEAITKADIEALIKEGIIKKKPKKGIKRRAGKIRQLRKRKGRKRRVGKKKKFLKKKKKNYIYINRIRNLRAYIKELKKKGIIDSKQSATLRKLAKASIIKTKKEIDERIK
ncbi:MAG: 50S ribosomal protein L19e [Candidatus Pacearchaeota archaeon]|nr:50S ribosomal protein L19e [Candidatus Pacearchaeota archaeon]